MLTLLRDANVAPGLSDLRQIRTAFIGLRTPRASLASGQHQPAAAASVISLAIRTAPSQR